METATWRLQEFMKFEMTNENSIYTVNELVGPEPIADSFSCAIVMFADISGFTSWSSNRNTVDVFQLLELLFKEFDIVGL